MEKKKLELPELEKLLMDVANAIRGEIDAPKYKDYILPLIFLKRLLDVFEDELNQLIERYEEKSKVEKLLENDHELVRFYIPKNARWDKIITHETLGMGEYLTEAVIAIANENDKLKGVIDRVDFNAMDSGERIVSDSRLKDMIEILNGEKFGLNDVEPDIFGRAYEYLLRKFAEGSGQSAGEFYTPGEVAILMSYILDPEPGDKIYDPCCGSGGLLIKCKLKFDEKYSKNSQFKPLQFFGQESIASTYTMAKMNIFIHDMEAEIAIGDTMNKPKFLNHDGSLRKFDKVAANPMWRQKFPLNTYEHDSYDRFTFGYPPEGSADWGWIQHMCSSTHEKGKVAVVLDTGTVFRGSGNIGKDKERDIRKKFVENNLIDSVILLPENLFYNTTGPGIILVIDKDKDEEEILLINASKHFKKKNSKNYLPNDVINKISSIYNEWKEEDGISVIIPKEEVIKNDYNLLPSRYVTQDNEEDIIPLEDAIVLLNEAEEERNQADKELKEVLDILGLKL